MTTDDIRLIRYMNAETGRFSFWLIFQDRRKIYGKKARKDLIEFFGQLLGPIGKNWEYEMTRQGTFIIKANNEADITLMILKFNR